VINAALPLLPSFGEEGYEILHEPGLSQSHLLSNVPPRVQQQVANALVVLAEIGMRFDEARRLDEQFSGSGRYVADTWKNRGADFDRAMKVVATFRQHAPSNGVDAEAVLVALGGVPVYPERPSLDGEHVSEMSARGVADLPDDPSPS